MSRRGSTGIKKILSWVVFPLIVCLVVALGVYLVGFRYLNNSKPDNNLESSANAGAIKLAVDKTGLYEIRLGRIDEFRFGEKISDFQQLRLFYHGREQPFWIEHKGNDSFLQFFAQTSQSIYSNNNSYWLVADNKIDKELDWQNKIISETEKTKPVEFPELSPSIENLPEGNYYAIERQEENKVYQPLVQEGDHWFWKTLQAPSNVSYEFSLSSLSAGTSLIRLMFWSGTEASVNPDHHAILSINGKNIADEYWDGKGTHLLEKEISNDLLNEGSNSITINAPGEAGVIADVINLNWFEIVYPRQPRALNDRLFFAGTGKPIQLSGFSGSIKIFDVTDFLNPKLIETVTADDLLKGYAFLSETKHNYIAVGPNGYYSPIEVSLPKLSPNLRLLTYHNAYLAIGAENLIEALQPLLTWRANQGYQTIGIPLQAVYDQYNYGIPEPGAIQSFVNYVLTQSPDSLKFMVLVGDASYDPRGYISPMDPNSLPTFLIQTSFGGETASDVLFGAKEGAPNHNDTPITLWPNFAIGRIPARNPDQVKILVQKIFQSEEKNIKSPKPLNIVAIADGQSESFKLEAQKYLDIFPISYNRELFSPPAGVINANQKILDYFYDDSFIISYFGHGSINLWGKDKLFSIDDIEHMQKVEHFPIVINMSCLTGLFTHPKQVSLAETLLWKKDGGAVAVLAPTSLTLPYDQSFLSNAIAEQIVSGKDLTLGQILQNARDEVPSIEQRSRDVLLTFLLFGDPALRLEIGSNN